MSEEIVTIPFSDFRYNLLASWIDYFQQVPDDGTGKKLAVSSSYPSEQVTAVLPHLTVIPLNAERFTTNGRPRYYKTVQLTGTTGQIIYKILYEATWQFDLFTRTKFELLEWQSRLEAFLFDNSRTFNTFKIKNFVDASGTETSNTVYFEHEKLYSDYQDHDEQTHYRQVQRIPFRCTLFSTEDIKLISKMRVIFQHEPVILGQTP